MDMLLKGCVILAGIIFIALGLCMLSGLVLFYYQAKEDKEKYTKCFYEERGRLPRHNAELDEFMNGTDKQFINHKKGVQSVEK